MRRDINQYTKRSYNTTEANHQKYLDEKLDKITDRFLEQVPVVQKKISKPKKQVEDHPTQSIKIVHNISKMSNMIRKYDVIVNPSNADHILFIMKRPTYIKVNDKIELTCEVRIMKTPVDFSKTNQFLRGVVLEDGMMCEVYRARYMKH